MVIEVRDGTTPMLGVLRHASREVAFEIMSKVGNRVRVNAGKKMNQQRHRHSWFQKTNEKSGIRQIYHSRSKQKNAGERTTKSGSIATPPSLKNMVSSYLMEVSGTLIVGGMSPKRTVITRRDGKRTGFARVNSAVGKHTQSIVHKLDTGERNENHGWGSYSNPKDSMDRFKNARYIGRRFMKDGFNQSRPYMTQQLTAAYDATVGRAVNREEIKPKVYKRRVV